MVDKQIDVEHKCLICESVFIKTKQYYWVTAYRVKPGRH